MSGGQQQMLAIARADVLARLLLVDEPSVELKSRFGLTVLMAGQNFHRAVRIADRGYIIVHGEIASRAGPSTSSVRTRS